MTAAAILYEVALAILLVRLTWMRMWLSLPAFFVYTAVSLAVEFIPEPKKNLHLWRIEWYIEATLIMLLRIAALVEVFWLAIMEFLPRERLYLLAGLSACAMAALSLVAFTHPSFTPIHNFTIFRQCVLLGMLFWMSLGGMYIWSRDIALEHNTKWHFIIFVALLAIKSAISTLDEATGLLPYISDGEALWFWDQILLSACFVSWTVAFTIPKHGHWWVMHRIGLRSSQG